MSPNTLPLCIWNSSFSLNNILREPREGELPHFISSIFLSFTAYIVCFCTTTENLTHLHGSCLPFCSPVSAQYHQYQSSLKSDSQAGRTPGSFLLKHLSRGEEIWPCVKWGQQPLLNHFKKVFLKLCWDLTLSCWPKSVWSNSAWTEMRGNSTENQGSSSHFYQQQVFYLLNCIF